MDHFDPNHSRGSASYQQSSASGNRPNNPQMGRAPPGSSPTFAYGNRAALPSFATQPGFGNSPPSTNDSFQTSLSAAPRTLQGIPAEGNRDQSSNPLTSQPLSPNYSSPGSANRTSTAEASTLSSPRGPSSAFGLASPSAEGTAGSSPPAPTSLSSRFSQSGTTNPRNSSYNETPQTMYPSRPSQFQTRRSAYASMSTGLSTGPPQTSSPSLSLQSRALTQLSSSVPSTSSIFGRSPPSANASADRSRLSGGGDARNANDGGRQMLKEMSAALDAQDAQNDRLVYQSRFANSSTSASHSLQMSTHRYASGNIHYNSPPSTTAHPTRPLQINRPGGSWPNQDQPQGPHQTNASGWDLSRSNAGLPGNFGSTAPHSFKPFPSGTIVGPPAFTASGSQAQAPPLASRSLPSQGAAHVANNPYASMTWNPPANFDDEESFDTSPRLDLWLLVFKGRGNGPHHWELGLDKGDGFKLMGVNGGLTEGFEHTLRRHYYPTRSDNYLELLSVKLGSVKSVHVTPSIDRNVYEAERIISQDSLESTVFSIPAPKPPVFKDCQAWVTDVVKTLIQTKMTQSAALTHLSQVERYPSA